MKFNYLRMIWDVNIYLAKIKDGKGKEIYFLYKKTLLTKIPPYFVQNGDYQMILLPKFRQKYPPMNLKEFAKDNFSLTTKECLWNHYDCYHLSVIFFLPNAISRNNTKQINADTAWISSMKRLEQKDSPSDNQYEKKIQR